jgi:autotransporter-associated beta strand protein
VVRSGQKNLRLRLACWGVALLALVAAAMSPADAQQGGNGGAGDYGSLTTPTGVGGGPGGTYGNDGTVGGRSPNYGNNSSGGGGGGGAVDANSLGGNGGAGGLGGVNGPTAGSSGAAGQAGFDFGQGSGIGGGQNGGDGSGGGSASGGGGGGGGFYGATAASTSNGGLISGGNGGNGGNGGVNAAGASSVVAGGGGGGAGGYGFIVTGAATPNTNSGTIFGGAGGAGGVGIHGGNGGDGGIGVYFSVSGASLTNSSSIAGGNGGAGGAQTSNYDYLISSCCTAASDGGYPGAAGAGGAGIVGAGLTVINTGTIAGGLSGAGVQADAITFTGGANNLTMNAGSLTGSLGLFNASTLGLTTNVDTTITGLGGDGDLTKDGSSRLTISGSSAGYSGDVTIQSGAIAVQDSGALGSGTVNLQNGTTLILDGSLNGSLNIATNFTVAGDPTFVTDPLNPMTISGKITDATGPTPGDVVVNGGGILTLSGANTYSGGIIVSGATVQVTNSAPGTSSSVGTGTVTLDNGEFQAGADNLTFSNSFKINNTLYGSAIDANGYALTISGNITDGSGGAGKLTVLDTSFAGGGVVILTGTNTYSGGTTICSCGTLQLGTIATTASIVGAVTNEGVFNIVNANTAGITSITTSGPFAVTTFFGANTAGTAKIVNQYGGNTTFLDTSTAGSANIRNKTGGTTLFGLLSGTDTSTAGNATIHNNNAGTIFAAMTDAGTAHITNRNGGGTIFVDQSSAASATIVNNRNGFTSFGQAFGTDTPTAGNATITNNFHGETVFNAFSTAGNAIITTNSGGATYFYDNSTGGAAQFITGGTGFVDFSRSLGPNGDGRVAAGSISGSGFYYIGAGNTLVVGGNNLSTAVSGVIADFNPCGCGPAGPGALEKVGTGTLTLSGTNTYTGTTTVNGGVLDVEGTIASSHRTTVNANASLTGAGTVGNTVIAGGGIFLPGNGTPGTSMTVSGSLAFQSGALYLVQINSATSTFANVTGAATLAGTVGVSVAVGSTVMKQYMILTDAGGHSGSFDGVGVLGAPAGLTATLSYDPTHVYLNFALDYGASPGLNVNQRKVGTALNNFFSANGTIPAAFVALPSSGLTQISGELATGSQQATFDAMNLFLGMLTDPFIAGRGDGVTGGAGATPFAEESNGASAYASNPNARSKSERDAYAAIYRKAPVAADSFNQRWSVWGASYGGGSTTDGNAALGSNTSTARAFGVVAGADYRFSPDTLAGFALAGGGTNFSVNNLGSGRSDLFQAGAFVRHNVGAAYVSAALAYGWQDVTTDRTVTVAGVDRLHAEFNANAWSGRVEGGYRYVTPWMGVTPYAAGQFTTFSLPAYAEQVLSGSGAFALSYAAKDVTDSRSELGVRTDKSFAMPDAILTLRGRFAWAHDFNADRNIQAVFQTLPGASFVVNGAAQAHDSALTTASAEMKWLNGFSLAATFEGEFSGVTTSYAGKGVARYAW